MKKQIPLLFGAFRYHDKVVDTRLTEIIAIRWPAAAHANYNGLSNYPSCFLKCVSFQTQ